uniref:Uncharacterized protein n=1 Tax=Arundo donax TaxID=35708 RepID=A0A0A9CXZ6_ARUDO
MFFDATRSSFIAAKASPFACRSCWSLSSSCWSLPFSSVTSSITVFISLYSATTSLRRHIFKSTIEANAPRYQLTPLSSAIESQLKDNKN